MEQSDPIHELVRIATAHRLATLYYRKGATRRELPARLVEAYTVTQGKQDLMVRCFQREPEEGWRFFMVHKIDRVHDTGRTFRPRTRLSLETGEIEQRYERDDLWSDARAAYRDLVSDALADGTVSVEERLLIDGLVQAQGLTTSDIRFVHTSIYHRCLAVILEDGRIDEQELAQLHFLNAVFRSLGWSPASQDL